MIDWILGNGLLTLCVMGVVSALCLVNRRRPALCHFLWVLAFVSLVLPPIPLASAPGTFLRSELVGWWSSESAALPVESPAPETAPTASPWVDVGTEAVLESEPLGLAEVSSEPSALQRVLAEFTLARGLVGLWLLGAALLVAVAGRRIRAFHHRVRGTTAAPQDLNATVAEVARRLGVAAPPVRLLEGVGSPAIWCFGRPQLLWPAIDGAPLRHDGERSLIAHELAHLARGDHWASRLDVLAIALCWWNPLFWIIRREIRHYAELSCDAWALWAYPTRRRVFAEALIDAQERTLAAPVALEGLCATNSEFKNFERRLSMIMKKDVSRQVSKGAATAALLTTLLVLPGFSGDGKECAQTKAKACEEVASACEEKAPCLDGLVEAKRRTQEAEELFQAQEWKASYKAFEQMLELDPKNGLAHARLGYMLVGEGKHEAARKHLRVQAELGFKPAVAVYNLACVASLSGDLDEGQALLEKAVRRGFADPELMAGDGDLANLRETQGYTRAMLAAKESRDLRAKLKHHADELSLANAVVLNRELARIVTEDGELQDRTGLLALKAGDYAAGLEAFQRQAAVGHEVARANYNIACAHALLGDQEAALDALEKAVKLGMNYPAVAEDADLANLHGSERFQELVEHLRAPKLFDKKLQEAIESGDYELARSSLLELRDNPEVAAKARAWAAYKLGTLQREHEPERSIATFERAMAMGYSIPDGAFQIGCSYAALGDCERAAQHFEKAVVLGFAQPAQLSKAMAKCGIEDEESSRKLLKAAKLAAEEAEYESKKKQKMAEWFERLEKEDAAKAAKLREEKKAREAGVASGN